MEDVILLGAYISFSVIFNIVRAIVEFAAMILVIFACIKYLRNK